MTELPVDTLYNCRKDFTIIGLTGVAGSGCSTLASMMTSKDFLLKVRTPESISVTDLPTTDNEKAFKFDKQRVQDEAIGKEVFRRKYSICYNFAKSYYEAYDVIKFTHVIWLYIILCFKKSKETSLKDYVLHILKDKYMPSTDRLRDQDYYDAISYKQDSRNKEISRILDCYPSWKELSETRLPNDVIGKDHIGTEDAKALADIFFTKENEFNKFINYLFEELSKLDYYSLCFLNHRAAFQIRLTGEIERSYHEIYPNRNELGFGHQYDLIRLVNFLIKGYRKRTAGGTRLVIDSLRNSTEAWFLKERYSAFYLISVNDDKNRQQHLLDEIKEKTGRTDDLVYLITDKVDKLSAEEVKPKEFESGVFSAPNVEQVIADAEIHINNNIEDQGTDNKSDVCAFSTMSEQWMKYSSLILHPGLITPSAEERCMSVAYTSKFNSSCISRQVGAVITNSSHSIRTIGWNDVAYGQIPCGLRDLREIAEDGDKCSNYDCCYSLFEKGNNPKNRYDNDGFTDKVKKDYRDVIKGKMVNGLPLPYCFKDLHNRYKGEKNQVFTRSLHAEENAMLQMVKYGGEPLMNGIIYVTASPCELCSKKLYQIGVRKIVYIDPYPGIARDQIIHAGFKRPALKMFEGAYGSTYFKLYQPFMSYKDELDIRFKHKHLLKTQKDLLLSMLKAMGVKPKNNYTDEEIQDIIRQIKEKG